MYKTIDRYEILDIINELNISYKEKDGRYLFEHCPYCENDGTKEPYKNFSMDADTGQFNCWRKNKCGAQGNASTIKNDFSIGDQKLEPKVWSKPKPIKPKSSNGIQQFYKWYEKTRGIKPETLKAFDVQYKEANGDTFIVYSTMRNGKAINRKYRGVNDKKKMWTEKDCERDFYGQQTITQGAKELFVTEGEDDCHALYQYGFTKNVVSLPFGAGTYTPSMHETLSQFDKIYLVFDNDAAGDKGADNFAKKAGFDRCKRVRLPKKDARECILQGVEHTEIIESFSKAEQVEHEHIVTSFTDYGRQLVEYYDPSNMSNNVTLTDQKHFDNLVRGFGPGEVTVVTGNTGSGKTSFCYNLLHWIEKQRRNVMAFSFENQHIQVTRKILDVATGTPCFTWDEDVSRVVQTKSNEWIMRQCRQLEIGGWHMYRRKKSDRGNMTSEVFRGIVSDAVKFYGVTDILLDHFHYMGKHKGDNLTHELDTLMRDLKMIAVEFGIHLIVVAHPSKVGSDRNGVQHKVGLDHGKGTSSISQESDHFIVVEKIAEGWSETRILKGREEGKEGTCYWSLDANFNRFAQSYNEVPKDVVFNTDSIPQQQRQPQFSNK